MLTLIVLIFTTNCKSQNDDGSKNGVFIDERDGTEYQWVKMEDGKTWMATNLRYEDDNSECYGGEDGNCQKFGRLYL
ncbi:MAG: FISUMP domain-containing protein, partial [Bacteroidota bacterium]